MVVCISYNILINLYCFGVHGDRCSFDKIAAPGLVLMFVITCMVFHNLPHIRYDLFHQQAQITMSFISINAMLFIEILYRQYLERINYSDQFLYRCQHLYHTTFITKLQKISHFKETAMRTKMV